jgi:hypothetical protein
MPDSKAYAGSCHCGHVRYEATADLSKVVDCNCSICMKRGALWTFVTPDKFALQAGGDAVQDYQFGKKVIHHLFCPHCGVGAFSRGTAPDGRDIVAINVRCLEGVDVSALNRVPFDGKSL